MTKKILIDEAVVKQALEALKPLTADAELRGDSFPEGNELHRMADAGFKTLTALREALEVDNKGVNALTEQAAEPVAWPEHEFIQWGAKKYGPLLRAAIELLADVDNNLEVKDSPQKFGVPFGKLVALRAAIEAAHGITSTNKGD